MIHECLHLVRTTTNMQHQHVPQHCSKSILATETAPTHLTVGPRYGKPTDSRQPPPVTMETKTTRQNNKIKTNNATTSKPTMQQRQKNIKTKTPKMLIFFFLFDERNVLQNVHKKRRSCGASRVASPDTHVFSGGAGGRVFHECLQGRGDHLADLCGQFFRFDRREQAADLGCKLREKS